MELLCVDYSNLIVRHSHANFNAATNADGEDISGAVGAISQVVRLLREHNPTHLLIARDSPRHTLKRRTEVAADYKQHRPEADDGMRRQFTTAYLGAGALGWHVLAVEGYEADDVIASAVSKFDGPSVVVSGDKDMLALCSAWVRVQLLRPGGSKMCGPRECEELMGVAPDRVRDLKALVGDRSDGIVGVPQVGPKTALALLHTLGTLEAIYRALDTQLIIPGVSPKVRERLESGRELAWESFELARMESTLPVDVGSLLLSVRPSWALHGPTLEAAGLGALEGVVSGAPRASMATRVPDSAADHIGWAA